MRVAQRETADSDVGRVPSQLPQLIAVSSVILFASLLVVLLAEIIRRMVERRYGAEYAARGLA